jgi:hypothetical protein
MTPGGTIIISLACIAGRRRRRSRAFGSPDMSRYTKRHWPFSVVLTVLPGYQG